MLTPVFLACSLTFYAYVCTVLGKNLEWDILVNLMNDAQFSSPILCKYNVATT